KSWGFASTDLQKTTQADRVDRYCREEVWIAPKDPIAQGRHEERHHEKSSQPSASHCSDTTGTQAAGENYGREEVLEGKGVEGNDREPAIIKITAKQEPRNPRCRRGHPDVTQGLEVVERKSKFRSHPFGLAPGECQDEGTVVSIKESLRVIG